MPRKVGQTQRFLQLTENLTVLAINGQSPRGKKRRSRDEYRSANFGGVAGSALSGESLMRTRRLLMAALRVWELRNGIHEPY